MIQSSDFDFGMSCVIQQQELQETRLSRLSCGSIKLLTAWNCLKIIYQINYIWHCLKTIYQIIYIYDNKQQIKIKGTVSCWPLGYISAAEDTHESDCCEWSKMNESFVYLVSVLRRAYTSHSWIPMLLGVAKFIV